MMSERSPEMGVARFMGLWKLRPKSQVLYRIPGIGIMGSLVFYQCRSRGDVGCPVRIWSYLELAHPITALPTFDIILHNPRSSNEVSEPYRLSRIVLQALRFDVVGSP